MTYPTTLASIDEVKDRLNVKGGTDDAEIQEFLDSATQVLANLYGDVLPVQYTERLQAYGDGSRVLLGRSPLLSIDTVQVIWGYQNLSPVTLAPTTYRADLRTGELRLFATSAPFAWQYASRDWSLAEFDITYTAGRAAVTPAVKDAVLEILRVNWQPQQSGNLPGVGDDDAGFTYMGYYIPNSANERLAGGMRPRQIA